MKMTSAGIGTHAQGERAFALLKDPWQAVLIVGVIQNWIVFQREHFRRKRMSTRTASQICLKSMGLSSYYQAVSQSVNLTMTVHFLSVRRPKSRLPRDWHRRYQHHSSGIYVQKLVTGFSNTAAGFA